MWRKLIWWGNISVNISSYVVINTEESFTAESAEFAEFLCVAHNAYFSAVSACSAVEKL
jgi:hypothetical protein